MYQIINLINRVEDNGHRIWKSIPASDEAIFELETELGCSLPESLKQFLAIYGALAINDTFLSGIIDNKPLEIEGGNIIGDTTFIKRNNSNFPSSFIVIQMHEDGAFCLDLSEPNSVFNFESGSITKVAENFETFIIKYYLNGLANDVA